MTLVDIISKVVVGNNVVDIIQTAFLVYSVPLMVFVAIVRRIELRERGEEPISQGLVNLKKVILHIPFMIVYGTIPSIILYCCSKNIKEFNKNIGSFLPIDQIVIYYSVVFMMALIVVGIGYIKKTSNKRFEKFVKMSSSSLEGLFQLVSGVGLGLVVISMFVDTWTVKMIFINVILVSVAFAMLIPAILANEVRTYYETL